MRRLDTFASEDSDKRERNGVRAAKLVRRLATSDSWGARPSVPAFVEVLSSIVTRDTTPLIEVRPIMPSVLVVGFPQRSFGPDAADKLDPRPTLHSMARAFELVDAHVVRDDDAWVLQGLHPSVHCGAREERPDRLEPVSKITLVRTIPEDANGAATAQLGIALRGVQRAGDLAVLDEMVRWFPLRARSATSVHVETGLHWIDLNQLLASLALPIYAVPPQPIERFSMALPQGKQLQIEAYLSRDRWIRTLVVSILK